VREHVVSISYEKDGKPQRRFFAVPAGESDPEFLTWLKVLSIPTGSAGGQLATGASRDASQGAGRFAQEREKAYPAFFGKKWSVRRDAPRAAPPIDVYVFEPGEDDFGNKRDFYTLATSGMSDAAMPVPDGLPRRAELLLYVQKPADEHVEVLQWLARLPHAQQGTWFGGGTTMTNGQPPQPIFEGGEANCYLFLFPVVGKDSELHSRLVLDGDPTVALWVVPITHPECQFILDNSLKDFLNVLDKKKHPFLLNEKRRSYVGEKGKGLFGLLRK
jgi:hypothetical protein